jgi:transcriptional regulator with XRE-family HTH domain
MDDWGAAGDAIRDRMRELNMSTAELARETGLSETTIRYLGRPDSRHNRSVLVTISAVLRWRYDHLLNILHGEPHKNAVIKPPLDQHLRQILQSEISPLKEKIAALADTVERLVS